MNLPPSPDGVDLGGLLRETVGAVLSRSDLSTLMSYHAGAGTLGQKAAAVQWCAPVLGPWPAERMLLAPGAQAGLAAALAAVCRPGDAVVTEPLTYPGIKTLAERLGLRLIACPTDAEGPRPDALDRLCREAGPAAVYLVPTMQNPTAITLGRERRRRLAAVARERQVWIVEDDPYSRLLEAPPPAVASFAPERTIHIATLAKVLSPGLRLAFLATPAVLTERVAEALRAFVLMPSPLLAAIAGRWIREGQAEAVLAGVQRGARARRAIAAEWLPGAVGDAASLHVWLPLPPGRSGPRLREQAAARGLALVTAEQFAVAPDSPDGARISLGAPGRRATLRTALAQVAEMAAG